MCGAVNRTGGYGDFVLLRLLLSPPPLCILKEFVVLINKLTLLVYSRMLGHYHLCSELGFSVLRGNGINLDRARRLSSPTSSTLVLGTPTHPFIAGKGSCKSLRSLVLLFSFRRCDKACRGTPDSKIYLS